MKELIALFVLVSFGTANDAIAVAGEAAIQGRVIITKVMTKKRVTLPGYDLRGATVNSQNPDKSAASATTADEFSRVVIYLEGPGLAQAAPVRDTLAQKNRHFDPEIVVVPVGSTVSFPNDDPIFHNVFSLSKVKSFDLGYYPAGETRSVKFERAGIVQVYCHIHPEMSAAIFVLPTKFWTRPDADGSFSLSGVPPGTYDLVAWHRSAGFFRRHLTVTDDKPLAVEFLIPLKDQAPGGPPAPGREQ